MQGDSVTLRFNVPVLGHGRGQALQQATVVARMYHLLSSPLTPYVILAKSCGWLLYDCANPREWLMYAYVLTTHLTYPSHSYI
jgi:hypothetical protein